MSENSLSSWVEWKEKCALDLCEQETSQYLTDFIYPRFLKRAQTAGQGKYTTPGPCDIDKKNAWHLFETYFKINESKSGKCHKDWLFDRTRKERGTYQQQIEGGATLLLRSAVREFLRREYALNSMISMQAPIGAGGLTIEDLLPGYIDPSCEAELKEYHELGNLHAGKFAEKLSDIEITCILAKYLNISLADPRVTLIAGKKKAVLYDTYNSCIQRLADSIRKDYSNDDPECIEILTVCTLQAIHQKLFKQKKTENSYAELFTV